MGSGALIKRGGGVQALAVSSQNFIIKVENAFARANIKKQYILLQDNKHQTRQKNLDDPSSLF